MLNCRRLGFSISAKHVRSQIRALHSTRLQSATLHTTPLTNPDVYDIVCVGGGPVGLGLVNGLTTSSLKIALVESQSLAQARKPSDATFSNRCSSLTPASVRFLENIGTWKHVDKARIQPYDAMRVWDGISGSRIDFDWAQTDMQPESGPTIAFMAENSNLVRALLSQLDGLGGVALLDNTKVEGIELGQDDGDFDMRSWPILSLSNGNKLAARLLIGADGANSPVRDFAYIQSHGWDYQRHGVVATLKMSDSDSVSSDSSFQGTAYQRFLPTGPIALLPLPGGHASLVWSTLPKHAALLKSLAPEDLVGMINAGFRLSKVDLEYLHTISTGHADEYAWRKQHTPIDRSLVPREVVAATQVASFPLKMRHADAYTGERVALAGDAAHSMHPLAGQGLNAGLGDAAALVQTLAGAVSVGADIGSTLALEPYAAARYARNHALLGAVDKLHALYSFERGPVVWARSLGLGGVNALGPVKGWLMRQAAGGA